MIARIKALIFPPRCGACGELLDWYDAPIEHSALCATCLSKWKSEKLDTCEQCAGAVSLCRCMPNALRKSGCRALRKLTYYRHGMREPVQNRVIYRIKEARDRRTVDFLASEWMPMVENMIEESGLIRSEVILTYLPRGRGAWLRYGTDQARELALALARQSGIPCRALLKRRAWREREQKKLDARGRYANAERAFCLTRAAKLPPRSVILIDDIVTTGASLSACVRLLRMAGVEQILALAIATDDQNG